jgi:hypothetical protein
MLLLAALLCNYGRGKCLIDIGTEGNREHLEDSAQSETPGMHGNSALGNRETPSTPIVQFAEGRLEKAMSQKSSMHVGGESDGCVVPTK